MAAATGEGTRAPGPGVKFSADVEKLPSLAVGSCVPEADQTILLAASATFGCVTHMTGLSHGRQYCNLYSKSSGTP